MFRSARVYRLAATAVMTVGSSASFAQIQTPGQMTPRSFAPETQRNTGAVNLSALPDLTAPEGSDKIPFKIGDVVIEGESAEVEQVSREIIARLKGQTVSVAFVYEQASALERAYADVGFFLTRVTIPAQAVKPGGTLRIKITRGFIESYDTSDVPDRVKSRVDQMLARLIGRIDLKSSEFQRVLLLVGDTVGLEVKSSIAPGDTDGAVKLIIAGTHKLYKGESSTSNSLSPEMGAHPVSANTAINSFFGYGEQIYFALNATPALFPFSPKSPLRTGAVGISIPIGVDGLVFNTEYARAASTPMIFEPSLPTDSQFQRWTARLSYPIIRSRTTTVNIRTAFDAIQELAQAPNLGWAYLYEDQLRTLRVAVDGSHSLETGTSFTFGAEVTQGLNILGSRGRNDATIEKPISRGIADNVFTKLEGRIGVRQDLGSFIENTFLDVQARTQLALTGPLMRSQQTSITGPGAISAYPGGAFSGDSSWMVRAELQYTYSTQILDYSTAATPYLFVSRGHAYTLMPTVSEVPVIGGTGAGFGVKTYVYFSDFFVNNVEMGFELGHQFSDTPTEEGNQWRFNFYATARF